VIRGNCGATMARRLMIGAVALLIPAVAGCEAGLNAPTLQFHASSGGATAAVDGISVSDAFVLGGTGNSLLPAGGSAGLFVALYNNNSQSDKLLKVSAPGTASNVQLDGGSVNLPGYTAVNLTGPSPKVVLTGLTQPLTSGQTVQVILDFARAGAVSLSVPVEPQAFQYATYSAPPPTPSASPSATASASPSTKAKKKPAKTSASPSPSATS
jgi:copper(I)-binding protein